jgi:hypothetical protein
MKSSGESKPLGQQHLEFAAAACAQGYLQEEYLYEQPPQNPFENQQLANHG